MRPLAPHPVLASRLAAPWLALLALSLPASARADTPPPSARPPLDRAGVLDRQALITAVLAENPSVEAARQAVRAAKARPAQEHALDDPMLGYTIAPASIATDAVRFGQNRPGLKCLNGICRIFPAFAGIRLLAVVRI